MFYNIVTYFVLGSSSPPDPVPDPVITITETSDSLSEAVGLGSTADNTGNLVKLSLWLQWTLPKCNLTFHSVNDQGNGEAFCFLNYIVFQSICMFLL